MYYGMVTYMGYFCFFKLKKNFTFAFSLFTELFIEYKDWLQNELKLNPDPFQNFTATSLQKLFGRRNLIQPQTQLVALKVWVICVFDEDDGAIVLLPLYSCIY